jgi:hypothetical protein
LGIHHPIPFNLSRVIVPLGHRLIFIFASEQDCPYSDNHYKEGKWMSHGIACEHFNSRLTILFSLPVTPSPFTSSVHGLPITYTGNDEGQDPVVNRKAPK